MKKLYVLTVAIISIIVLCLLAGCGGNDAPADTAPADTTAFEQTDGTTEDGTLPDDTAEESFAEESTEEATEEATEAETIPEGDNILTGFTSAVKIAFGTCKETKLSFVDEGVQFLFSGSANPDPFVAFSIDKCLKKMGKPGLTADNGRFVVFRLKASGTDGLMELFTHAPAANDSATSVYSADAQWQFVIVDMSATTFMNPKSLTTMRIDWSGTGTQDGAKMIISHIAFFKTLEEAEKFAGIDTSPEDDSAARLTGITFPKDKPASDVASVTDGSVTLDNGLLTVTPGSAGTIATFNIGNCASLLGGIVERRHYLAVTFTAEDPANTTLKLLSVTDKAGKNAAINQTASPSLGKDALQGVIFDLRRADLKSEVMKKLSLSVSGSSVTVQKITVTDDLNEALAACGHDEYKLTERSGLSDNDPLKTSVLTAKDENAAFSIWFDQTTEKVLRTNTESSGITGYTVRMAKNEIENCQFFIAPDKTGVYTVTFDEFTDGNGNKLPATLHYEYYHNITGLLIPDALPELTGAIPVAEGTSQGFILKFRTAQDTPAGTYNSVIRVFDGDKEIKCAPVAVRVWDFALSDETALRTAFAIWEGFLNDSYPADWPTSKSQLYRNYYDFFLENRICIMDPPSGMTSSVGKAALANPRLNTARLRDFNDKTYLAEILIELTQEQRDKIIAYKTDEPDADDEYADLKAFGTAARESGMGIEVVCPFYCDQDLDASGKITTPGSATQDSIGFMSGYVNVWCPKIEAFTTRDLRFIGDTSFLQSKEQDEKYGTFGERMAKEVAGGDELWAYICLAPTEPYVNWQLLSDGTEAIISMWQLKKYDITGLLYWAVDYWKTNYWDNTTPWTGSAYGDGVLIYPGYAFGSDHPISTLRLESVRDGIEDYQMLTMLESLAGKEKADEIVSMVTTSVVTYISDDDYLHAVRVLLGDTLEQYVNK